MWAPHHLSPLCNGPVCTLSELNDYQRDFLPPVTAQPSHPASVVASILEQHAAELSAAQEWDNEWKSQGLLSRLSPQARHRPPPSLHSRVCAFACVFCSKLTAVVGTGVPVAEAEPPAETHRGAAPLGRAALLRKCLRRPPLGLGPGRAPAGLQVLRALRPRPRQGHPLHPHAEVYLHTGEEPSTCRQLR